MWSGRNDVWIGQQHEIVDWGMLVLIHVRLSTSAQQPWTSLSWATKASGVWLEHACPSLLYLGGGQCQVQHCSLLTYLITYQQTGDTMVRQNVGFGNTYWRYLFIYLFIYSNFNVNHNGTQSAFIAENGEETEERKEQRDERKNTEPAGNGIDEWDSIPL